MIEPADRPPPFPRARAWRVGATSFLLIFTSAMFSQTGVRRAAIGTPGICTRRAVVVLTDLVRQHGLDPRIGRERLQGPPSLTPRPLSSSPELGSSFSALEDNNIATPPDTHGAVGQDHLMVALNSEVRIQNRAGDEILTVALAKFWERFHHADVFDPKVLYDPYTSRWIFAALADRRAPGSSVLIAVSRTNDPTREWLLYDVDADETDRVWAANTSLGFNKDWIVVQVNMIPVSSPQPFDRTHIYVFQKADLYAGGAGLFTLISDKNVGHTQVPAITYDNTLATLYLLQDHRPHDGILQLFSITGPVGSESLTSIAFPSTTNPWDTNPPTGYTEFAPQLSSTRKILNNDSHIQNVVYRNGSIWACHTVFLPPPEGGIAIASRTAVQWWQISPSGRVLQFGRVDDPSGKIFYAFPSIAVNKNDDMLIGYSRFSATQYASANYSFRLASDPTSALRADTVLKAGEAPYYKVDRFGRNAWGDWSSTVVDPANDTDLWTIQEYASPPVNGIDRWGTWWGRILPGDSVAPSLDIQLSKTSYVTDDIVAASELRVKNPRSAAVAVRLRVYLKIPGHGETTLVDIGSDGSFSIPANMNQNFGPVSVFTVTAEFPRGKWEFNSRMESPKTGTLLSEDINPFQIQ